MFSPEWLYEKGIAKAAISLYTTGKDPTKRSTMEMSSYKHANSLVDQLLKEAKCQVQSTKNLLILIGTTGCV